MSKERFLVIVWAVVFSGIQVGQIGAQEKPVLNYVPGELLVRFATIEKGRQLNSLEKNSILNSLGGAMVEHDFRIVQGLSLIKLPENQKVAEVLSVYNAREGILYAEPNYRLEYLGIEPNDTYFGQQWGLHNIGQVAGKYDADIDAPEAWQIRTDADPNIIVAVSDSGVDYTHPDLADNMWINESEFLFTDNDLGLQ